jgi:hypothetical protein
MAMLDGKLVAEKIQLEIGLEIEKLRSRKAWRPKRSSA